MQDYFSVEAISHEIGISDKTVYKRASELGIDTSKITKTKKDELIKACEGTIEKKRMAQELTGSLKNAKLDITNTILDKSGATHEERLTIAKQDYDKLVKNIVACDYMIEIKGEFISNSNGSISSNPAVKTKCELLKQKNSLDKTISDLEDKLKYSISSPQDNVIDD